MAKKPTATASDSRLLLRRREAASMLGVSETQMFKWERAGVIPAVQVPGIRAIRYRSADVRSLAENIIKGRLSSDPAA